MTNVYFYSGAAFDNYAITDKDMTPSLYKINAFMINFFFTNGVTYRNTNIFIDSDINLNIEEYINKTSVYSIDCFHTKLNTDMKIDLINNLQFIADNRNKFNVFNTRPNYAESIASIINISLYK